MRTKASSWVCLSQGCYVHLPNRSGSPVRAQQYQPGLGTRTSLRLWLRGKLSLPGRALGLITVTAIRCHKSIRSLLFLGRRAVAWDGRDGMMKWPLGWHLGAGDAPGKGDELRLLGGDSMSLMMPLSPPEVTVPLHPAAAQLSPSPSPPGSPAVELGTGRRWQQVPAVPRLALQ